MSTTLSSAWQLRAALDRFVHLLDAAYLDW